jgi:hypothetical protein
MTWPPELKLVRRNGAIWITGLYDPTDERFPPGPYRGNEVDAVADAQTDIKTITDHYERNRKAYKAHALEYETLAEEAELWAEMVRGRPCPTYGTPGWGKMYAAFIEQLFNNEYTE